MVKNCVFCKIARKELPSIIVYEDDDITCFLDIDPINEGHLLVIPNRYHTTDLDEIPDEIVVKFFLFAKKAVAVLKRIYSFPGYSIMQNGGKFCDTEHFHLHIFPRYGNGDFNWTFAENRPIPLANDEVANAIRDLLK